MEAELYRRNLKINEMKAEISGISDPKILVEKMTILKLMIEQRHNAEEYHYYHCQNRCHCYFARH